MKVRDGHVSNSSSSSFLLICTPEVFDKAIEKANDDYIAFVAKQIKGHFKKAIADRELVIVSEINVEGESSITRELRRPPPTITKKRGCKHNVNESHSFCPTCGRPRIIGASDKDTRCPSDAWYEFKGILKQMMDKDGQKDIVIEHHDF